MSKGGVNQACLGFLSTGLTSSRRGEAQGGTVGSRGMGAPGQEGMRVPDWSLGGVGAPGPAAWMPRGTRNVVRAAKMRRPHQTPQPQ